MIGIQCPRISTFAFFAAFVIGRIDILPIRYAIATVSFVFCFAIPAGTTDGSLVRIGVICPLIDFPITIGQGMFRILRGTVSARAAYSSTVLAVTDRSPGTIRQ